MNDPRLASLEDIEGLITDCRKILKLGDRGKLKVEEKLIKIPSGVEVVVVGDLHGDLTSLNQILQQTDLPRKLDEKEPIYLVCLGDYIDRGQHQIELLHTLLGLMVRHPNNVILLRGNHEGPREIHIRPHDFPRYLEQRYGKDSGMLYDEFRNLFDDLYVACLLGEKYLTLHGCIPSMLSGLEDISKATETYPENNNLVEILWNDPVEGKEISPSARGRGYEVGVERVDDELKKLGIRTLIRSHEFVSEGYNIRGKIVTIFSCKLPVYGNQHAAYIRIGEDADDSSIEDSIVQF